MSNNLTLDNGILCAVYTFHKFVVWGIVLEYYTTRGEFLDPVIMVFHFRCQNQQQSYTPVQK